MAFVLIVFFCLSIMLAAVTFFFTAQVKEDIKDGNKTTVSFIRNNIDKEISKMLGIGSSIAADDSILKIASSREVSISGDYDTIVQAQKIINSFESRWEVDVYVYSKMNNCVLTSNAFYESDMYFSDAACYLECDIKNFKQQLENVEYFSVLGIYEAKRSAGKRKYVVSATPIINMKNGKCAGVVVAEIDNSLFIGEDTAMDFDRESITLFNSKNDVMLKYGNEKLDAEQIEHIKENSGEIYNDKYSYFTPSSVNNWYYICSFSTGKIGSSVAAKAIDLICIFIVICILGIVCAYFLANRMNRPMEKLLEKYSDLPKEGYLDEFKFIDDAMQNMKKENLSLKTYLEESSATLKNHVINSILNGENKFEKRENLCKILDADRIYEYFQVAVIGSEHSEESIAVLNNAQIIFAKRFNDLKKDGLNCFTLRKRDDLLVVIFNMSENYSEMDKIYYMLKEIVDFSKLDMNFVSVGLGGQYKDISGVSQSYVEAFYAYDKKSIKGYNCIISIEELDRKEMVNRFTINESYEKMLINSVKSGSDEQMRSLLDDARNFVLESDNELETGNICSMLVIILIKTINSMEISTEDIFEDDLALRKILNNNSEGKYKIEKIIECYNTVVKYVLDNKEGRYRQIYNEVIKIVEKEYANEINLNEIANKLNLSASYVNWIFKNNANINFSDYIASFRIEKAKELLKNGNYGIAEVGKMVGISNSNSFIRLFKKHEDMTPGAYKEMHSI